MPRKRIVPLLFFVLTMLVPRAWAGRIEPLQMLPGATLVAGKTTALRVYLDDQSAPFTEAEVVLVRPDGKRKTLTFFSGDMKFIGSGPGSSIVMNVPGSELPIVGEYYLRVTMKNFGVPGEVSSRDRTRFEATKDLRVGVDRTYSFYDPQEGESEAFLGALIAMNHALPVRDGVALLDQNYTSGVRYVFQDNPQPADSQICPFMTAWAFKNVGDRIDRGITYRYPNDGVRGDECQGGNAGHYCQGVKLASIVFEKALLGRAFTHEMGHLLGASHSPILSFDQALTAAGYNPFTNGLWQEPLSDVMWRFSSYDNYSFNPQQWEQMRQSLLQLDSTGPSGPVRKWTGTWNDNYSDVRVIRQNAQKRMLIYRHAYGTIHIQREKLPNTNAWEDREDLGNPDGMVGNPLPVLEADGRVTIFAQGSDQHVYHRAQFFPNGDFNGWRRMTATPVSAFTIARNDDGRLEAFLIQNGQLYNSWQITAGNSFGAAQPLYGGGLSNILAAEREANGRLRIFVVGGDGLIYSRVQSTPGSATYDNWVRISELNAPRVHDLRTVRLTDGRIALFWIQGDERSMAFRVQSAANSTAFDAPTQLWGTSLRDGFRVARMGDGRLMLFVVGGNSTIYQTFQVDANDLTRWAIYESTGNSGWRIDTSLLPSGELDLFAINTSNQAVQGRP